MGLGHALFSDKHEYHPTDTESQRIAQQHHAPDPMHKA